MSVSLIRPIITEALSGEALQNALSAYLDGREEGEENPLIITDRRSNRAGKDEGARPLSPDEENPQMASAMEDQ